MTLFDTAQGKYVAKDYHGAIADLTLALTAPEPAPINIDILKLRGKAYYYSNTPQNTPKAIADFDEVLTLNPEDEETLQYKELALGLLMFDQGNYEKAIKNFDTILQEHPKTKELQGEALKWRGCAKLDKMPADALSALADFNERIEMGFDCSEDELTLNNFRIQANLELERYTTALLNCNTALKKMAEVEKTPKHERICLKTIFLRGQVLYKLNRYEAAIADFNVIHEKMPKKAHLYLEMLGLRGQALYKLNRYEEAIADFSLLLAPPLHDGRCRVHHLQKLVAPLLTQAQDLLKLTSKPTDAAAASKAGFFSSAKPPLSGHLKRSQKSSEDDSDSAHSEEEEAAAASPTDKSAADEVKRYKKNDEDNSDAAAQPPATATPSPS